MRLNAFLLTFHEGLCMVLSDEELFMFYNLIL